MTLQEKIDKLPLSIEYEGVVNELELLATAEYVQVLYSGSDYSKSKQYPKFTLLLCERFDLDGSKSLFECIEIVVDRALTIIENNEWEK